MAEESRNARGGTTGVEGGSREGREGTARKGGALHTNRGLASGELLHDEDALRRGVPNVANAGRRERQLAGSAGEYHGREFDSGGTELFTGGRTPTIPAPLEMEMAASALYYGYFDYVLGDEELIELVDEDQRDTVPTPVPTFEHHHPDSA